MTNLILYALLNCGCQWIFPTMRLLFRGITLFAWIEIDMEEEFEFMFVSLFLIKLF